MQSSGNVRVAVQKKFERSLRKKSVLVCFLLTLTTKTLYDNFFKYFRTATSRNSFGRLLLEGFLFHRRNRQKDLRKKPLKNLRNFWRNNLLGYIYFLILAKKTTPTLMVSWEFCEMFLNSCFKGRFRTAASENIWAKVVVP